MYMKEGVLSSPHSCPQRVVKIVDGARDTGLQSSECVQTFRLVLFLQAQKALVEGKMVPCINMKPYVYQELLMTLPDLVAHFFPALHVSDVQTTLQEVLNLDLFQGNR